MDVRSGVENTLYRYAWSYDIGDIEGLADCFALDAESNFADSGIKRGREEIVSEMRRRRSKYPHGVTPWHIISNVFVTDSSETAAQVKSFYTFIEVYPGKPLAVRSLGYYDDIFVLENGIWRISKRQIVSMGADR